MRFGYKIVLIPLLAAALPMFGAQDARKERTQKGYLGIQIRDIDSRIEKRFKAPSDEGAYIDEVLDGSPAEKGGLKEDDIILSFNGKAVYDAGDLTRFVSRTAPDTKVDMIVWRDGARKTLAITVGKRKERVFSFRGPGGDHDVMVWAGRGSYGVELSTLGQQLGAYFGVPGDKGVLVESVKAEGPAAEAGLQAGDVITMVGKEKVTRSMDVFRELSEYEEGETVTIEAYRKGTKKTFTLKVEEGDEDGFRYFFEDFGGRGDGVIAPRIRMHGLPAPDIDVHMEGFEQDMDRMRQDLKESLDDVREQRIRIEKRAPLIRAGKPTITL